MQFVRNEVLRMLIVGIVGQRDKAETANLINSILCAMYKKVSVIDAKRLSESGGRLIKSYLGELVKNNVDALILKMDIDDLKNDEIKTICPDIVVYTDMNDDEPETYKKDAVETVKNLFSLLDEKSMIIVNADDRDIERLLEGIKSCIVTYGFSPKAVITTSSIGDTAFEDSFMCCLQKSISARNGLLLGPQEYRINVEQHEYDRHNILAAATFAIVNGIDPNMLNFSTTSV